MRLVIENPWFPGAGDRSLSEADIAEQRRKVALRQEAAARYGVAIGWIDEHGRLLAGAMRQDGSPPLPA